MTNEAFKRAMEILTAEERLAVNLVRVEKKSTWEAGEILCKSHYKFLEILGRGHHYLQIFTEHFTFHNTIVPDDAVHPNIRPFRHYMKLVIGERIKVKEAYDRLEAEGIPRKEVKNSLNKVMIYMKTSEKLAIRNYYNLICEFDKWNNFRILPRDHQEPSAFKRRHKTRQKRNLNYLLHMPPRVINLIIEEFVISPKSQSKLKAFIPLYKPDSPLESENLLVYATEANLRKLTNAGYPYFKNKNFSADMLRLIMKFGMEKVHSPKFGQEFWPKFREAMRRADNYAQLENLIPSRKHVELFGFDAKEVAKLEKSIYNNSNNLFGTEFNN